MLSVLAMSDLHGVLPPIEESVDVLILAGDICPDIGYGGVLAVPGICSVHQTEWLSTVYRQWESQVPAKHILMVPGNHDWVTGLPNECRTKFLVDAKYLILDDQEVIYRFYGTPWTEPTDGRWNYTCRRSLRKHQFDKIPTNLDVLISHGPAYKIGDMNAEGEHVGCPELRAAIYLARPNTCVYGHIHEGQRAKCGGAYGTLGTTQMINVAKYGSNWEPKKFQLQRKKVLDLPV